MNAAWGFKVEWDDEGCFLCVDADDARHRFLVHEPELLYAAVRSEVGPWLQEMESARTVFMAHQASGLCTAWSAGVGPCAREFGHDGDCGGEVFAA